MAKVQAKNTRKKRIFEIIEVGAPDDRVSRAYDIINMLSILINLAVSILYTFEKIRNTYGPILLTIEAITVAFLQLTTFYAYGRHSISTRRSRVAGQSGPI